MVRMLHVREPVGELPLVVVVEVAQRSNARAFRLCIALNLAQVTPQQIAKSFRSVHIATLANQSVKSFCKVVVQGHRYAFHGASRGHSRKASAFSKRMALINKVGVCAAEAIDRLGSDEKYKR